MLADGLFEGTYKGDRVAISHINGVYEVYKNGDWVVVNSNDIEVGYTVRIIKNGRQVYSAVSDTPSSQTLPEHLPKWWLQVS